MCTSVIVVADYLKSNCIELYDEIYNRGFADGLKIDKEDERNKAIDDFVNECIGYEHLAFEQEHIERIQAIAEQLKAGGNYE